MNQRVNCQLDFAERVAKISLVQKIESDFQVENSICKGKQGMYKVHCKDGLQVNNLFIHSTTLYAVFIMFQELLKAPAVSSAQISLCPNVNVHGGNGRR